MRAINCLKSIGVITIEDLLSTNCEELLLIRNCGNKTVSEIESFIISIKTKYGISKISSVPNNDVFSLQKESNSEKTKNITKIILSNLSISELSVRAQKCLEILKITTVEDLLALNQSNLTPLKNCGKKTISEIEELILLVKKKVGSVSRKKNLNICEVNPLKIDTNDNNPLLTIENSINNPVIEFISEADLEYANQYKSRYGYWPMVFILMRCIWNTLSTIEFAVFEYNYGMIPLHTEIDELTKYLAKDMFKEVLEKLRMNSSIKQLCRHEDWNYYYVNNIPIYVFDDENKDVKWERIGKLILQEKFFFNKYISEKKSTDEEDNQLAELLSIINLHTFKVFLQFWGHKPLWLDCSQNKLVPYCPQKEKMCHNPISPLVIERSFDSFMFNDAFAEIRRLQKIKTQDDIIISIRSYFIDNNDYWKKSVHLTNKDKAIFENILEELLIGICRANIVNGNLVIKANKIDVGEILYEILVDAKTRLHRDELLIRLRKMCHDKNLYCFTNSQQITYHLAKEPRIIAYGKSSYWGLKEWGESHSSIRELGVDYIKKSKTPIHIDELTKIILKTRPDSNENSISAIIRQTAANGELLLFFDDYVGYPQATYVNDYVLMPRSFKEWLKTFKEFVLKNKRYPLGRPNRYEGYLYRWHRKASQLRDLTPDEILQLDAMEKELSYYPHNTMEYNFLHNCDLYRKFVEGNNRMLEQTDDINLFKWFSNASIDYGTYEDNRKLYFSKLLQYISSKLY